MLGPRLRHPHRSVTSRLGVMQQRRGRWGGLRLGKASLAVCSGAYVEPVRGVHLLQLPLLETGLERCSPVRARCPQHFSPFGRVCV